MLRSETLIPLTSGAYKGRNAISDYQICENLFPEVNPENTDPAVPVTHYMREGERPLSAPPVAGPGRGLFTASNGALYAVVGNTFYYITPGWASQKLGTIPNLATPVSMSDNGTSALVVDGTSQGNVLTLKVNTFTILSDPTGTFVGASRVDFSDTYLAMNAVGTNGWMVTNPNSITFNALQQANADSTPDIIQTMAFNIRQMWILKTTHTELWYLAGSTPFPYQSWPNVLIPYGCDAKYSLVQADVDLFWISRNAQGHAIAVKTKGDAVIAISTRALEYEWSNYTTTSDCVGGTFQQAGHTFIIFHFPSADKTWGYDLATEQWHARIWIDSSGQPHRERATFYAAVGTPGGYPETVVGQDWQTGRIYALDPTYYTDNGTPIVCKRTFPHQLKDLREITHTAFVADFATGEIPGFSESAPGSGDFNADFNSDFDISSTQPPGADFNDDYNNDFNNAMRSLNMSTLALCMRYSKNGGKTWSNYRQKHLLTSGHYRSMMRYRGLGMGRDWIFELLWVYPGPCALNGAYADAIEHSS